jgi:hypothetical protein
MSAPTAFAIYRVIDEEVVADLAPVELLDSIRRHADRITVFCQSGQISIPTRFRLLAYLEDSIAPVRAPLGGVFHPKLWALRFVEIESGAPRYRILVASRNLTHDRSWDTVLRLDSADGSAEGDTNDELADFLRALPGMALQPIESSRVLAINRLADEITAVRFSLPPQVRSLRFLPLGYTDTPPWPFPRSCERLLVVSPFLQASLLRRLPRARTRSAVVTRVDAIESVGRKAAAHFGEHYVLSADALPTEDSAPLLDVPASPSSLSPDDPENELSGLHAKLYVIEEKEEVRVLTGSANATGAAFAKNVEFLVELRGARSDFGVETLLTENGHGEPTFRSLLVPIPLPDGPEREPDDAGVVLDELRRSFGEMQLRATIRSIDTDIYEVRFASEAGVPPLPEGVRLRCWPITSRAAERADPLAADGRLDATFSLTLEGLTAFLAMELRDDESATRFVLRAELLDAPIDRRTRLLRILLGDASRFLRYLLLLLADEAGSFDLPTATDPSGGDGRGWDRGWATEIPLLETMLRALARDPDRLEQVQRLIQELRSDEEGEKLLPPGLDAIWAPIWSVAQETSR